MSANMKMSIDCKIVYKLNEKKILKYNIEMVKLEDYTTTELKKMISSFNKIVKFSAYSKLKKAELITMIRTHPKVKVEEGANAVKLSIKTDKDFDKQTKVKKEKVKKEVKKEVEKLDDVKVVVQPVKEEPVEKKEEPVEKKKKKKLKFKINAKKEPEPKKEEPKEEEPKKEPEKKKEIKKLDIEQNILDFEEENKSWKQFLKDFKQGKTKFGAKIKLEDYEKNKIKLKKLLEKTEMIGRKLVNQDIRNESDFYKGLVKNFISERNKITRLYNKAKSRFNNLTYLLDYGGVEPKKEKKEEPQTKTKKSVMIKQLKTILTPEQYIVNEFDPSNEITDTMTLNNYLTKNKGEWQLNYYEPKLTMEQEAKVQKILGSAGVIKYTGTQADHIKMRTKKLKDHVITFGKK